MNTGNTHRTLTATASGMAASGIMQTLLANATPRIVDELAAPELYGLVAGSYLIASTVTLPLFAQYADRLGPRRIFVIGHLCFVIGTIAMVPAPNMPTFIAARIVQGVERGPSPPRLSPRSACSWTSRPGPGPSPSWPLRKSWRMSSAGRSGAGSPTARAGARACSRCFRCR